MNLSKSSLAELGWENKKVIQTADDVLHGKMAIVDFFNCTFDKCHV